MKVNSRQVKSNTEYEKAIKPPKQKFSILHKDEEKKIGKEKKIILIILLFFYNEP
jgi:hypothetical protein